MSGVQLSNNSSNPLQRRKVQNREAQRRYRENIKRKLKLAEAQMRTIHPSRRILSTTSAPMDNTECIVNTDGTDMCSAKEPIETLESSSPTLDFDWMTLTGACELSNELELYSPSKCNSNDATLPPTHSTIMHLAARKGHHNIVRILAEFGVNVGVKDSLGQTCLHLATAGGHSDTVLALIDAGIDIDVENIHGQTALFVAVDSGRDSIVRILLEAGADPNIMIQSPLVMAGAALANEQISEGSISMEGKVLN